MRDLFIKKTFLGLVWVLLVVSLLAYPGGANIVEAERGAVINQKVLENVGSQQATNQVIFDVKTAWKYFDKGQVPSSDWTSTAYNDSTWASGEAILGYGNGNERTKVSFGPSSSKKYITTYFRKAFTIENASAITALNLKLDQDDGAVVYLNGREVLRTNMPAGTVGNTTLASSCTSKPETKPIDPRLLINGNNVLAVEVHQCDPSSSDLTWSASLSAAIAAPTATAVPPTATATSVPPTATVEQPTAIVELPTETVEVPAVTPEVPEVTSIPPTETAGEPVVTEQPADPTATLVVETPVLPTLEPTPAAPVSDPPSSADPAGAAGAASVSQPLVYMNGVWRYYDKGQLPGSGWNTISYNANTWPAGSAILGYGNGDERTKVSYGSSASRKYITTYFRAVVPIKNAAAVTALTINLAKDDGAVVYLNGKEAFRANMPSGTVGYSTLASSCNSSPATKSVDPRLLVTGNNVLAVEVHQCEPGSSDLAFAASMTAMVTSGAVQPTATVAPTKPAPTATAVPPTATPPPTTSGLNRWYVSPNGSSSGNGSQSRPWDLQTALNHPSTVKPGDTIFLLAGTYRGAFKSYLRGLANAYISIRAYPGARATLMNTTGPALEIMNSWYVNFWGLEITSTYSTRSPSRSETTYGIRINQGSSNTPHHVRFINMVIHDVQAQGIGWWQSLRDSEIYGSLIYYNGTTQLDHGIYVNNANGVKTLRDSIVFDNASHGYHGYAETSSKSLNNLVLIGNTFFNNGSIGYNTRKGTYGSHARNILVGGTIRTNSPVVQENYTYNSGNAGTSLNLGYSGGSTNARITNNYFMGGQFVFGGSNSGVSMAGNSIYSPGGTTGVNKASFANNAWLSSKPTGVKIFVRRNGFEANRANITIYNWSRQSTVAVPAANLSGVALKAGDRYELRNAQNFYGDVITGVYNGSAIQVPMTGRSVAQPVGLNFRPASTFPEFGAFVLIVLGS